MNSNDLILIKRFEELYQRSKERYTLESTDFLDMNSQSILSETGFTYLGFGGYEGAERIIALFGDTEFYEDDPFQDIICTIKANVTNSKFISPIGHRDYLGAILALGIERSKIGDIIVCKDCAFIFCTSSVAKYIAENLVSAGRANIKCEITRQLPSEAVSKPQSETRTVSSERVDVMLCAVWNISRSEIQELFKEKKVFVNSRITEKSSKTLNSGDTVSLRGYGRFKYNGIVRTTKKDRLLVELDIWK